MDAEAATRMSQEAFDLAQSLSIEEFIGPALALQSLASSMAGNMDTSFELGERALAKWIPGTRRAERALCLDQMATGWYWTGEYERALEYGEQAISFAKEIKSSDSLLRTGSVHALTLTGMGRHEEALPRLRRSSPADVSSAGAPNDGSRAQHVQRAVPRPVPARRSNPAQPGGRGARCGSRLRQRGDAIRDRPAVHRRPAARSAGRGSIARAVDADSEPKGTHQWLMAGRLAEARAEIALAKGDHAEAARLARGAPSTQSRKVRRAKYSLAARLVLGQALMALGQPERGIDELHAALDGIRRLGHPPTLWRAWWTLGTRSLDGPR